jgi:hypothetical protein
VEWENMLVGGATGVDKPLIQQHHIQVKKYMDFLNFLYNKVFVNQCAVSCIEKQPGNC